VTYTLNNGANGACETYSVGRAKAGDGHAFLELVKHFERRVFRVAKLITQNDRDAENVLIETFLKACSDLDECKVNETFRVWLLTIAASEALLKVRQFPDGLESREEAQFGEISPWRHDHLGREEFTRKLENALRGLDPLRRAVFVLRDIEQMSIEDTALAVSLSVPVVKRRLLRARLQHGVTLTN
jgi:RNA polymerase sigma-70 factor (ECF subfamily)